MPCPVCRAQNWKLVFEVKDFSITQQLFSLAECENCSLRFTVGAPDKESIGPYYKSEKYISHTNSNKGVINQLYQWVRKYMFSKKRKLIEDITGKKVGVNYPDNSTVDIDTFLQKPLPLPNTNLKPI